MIVAYLALGILSGLLATAATLMAGGGLALAFGAYVLGGTAGMAVGILWALLPGADTADGQVAPQRG